MIINNIYKLDPNKNYFIKNIKELNKTYNIKYKYNKKSNQLF